MCVLLVAMLIPGVPSITEYFAFASLEMVNGTSESLELDSVVDGGDGRKSLQLDFVEPYFLPSLSTYWSLLLLTFLVMNQYPMNTISLLIVNIQ